MLALLLSVALSCPDTTIINSTLTFNDFDAETLEKARTGCYRMYTKNHCLVKFYKMDELTYRAICKDIKYIDSNIE